MRTFAYCRVSTCEQTTDNQIQEIRARGHDIPDHRVVSEIVSGGIQAMKRPEFQKLVEHKLEAGDTLVVLKLDRLGRDNIDVQQTITMLMDRGIKVVSLDLPVTDLTSAEGKLMLQMFSAFSEFEKNRIRERTQEGLKRAQNEGKKLGRPEAKETRKIVQNAKEKGMSQSQTVKATGLSLATVKRHWKG
ncbi:recombinase family protein [Vibrio fluvialis]|uniref:recombinase family protein n=1 Tax=Vibrio fluvialis TaxID=676 RepID=UPI001BAF4EFC|nr:recombinase family protein [Vibrio fluvialis]QUF70040.1 recombinase family protein [Vibrio fluvialis]